MSESTPGPSPRGTRADHQPLNPSALPVADAARVLSRLRGSGRPITEAMLRADIGAGAPTNPDGSLNLVHYAAWLVKQLSAGACAARVPVIGVDVTDALRDDEHGARPIAASPDREQAR